MRRKTSVTLALILVFALIFAGCAARRPLQTPVQPRQDTTGLYNNNRGVGSGTGQTTGTRTNTGAGANPGTGTYTGNGPSSTDPYDLGYGAGNNNRLAGTGTAPYYGGYNNGMYGGYGSDYRNIGGGNNSPNFALGNTGGTTQADTLARSLENVSGVDNATVVVSGNTAYVGIDTDGDQTGRNVAYGNTNDVAAVKRSCAQRVRATNPDIQTVYVSTDANFFDRLRKVGDGVRNGNAVDRFRNELSEMVRGITPERQ